MERISNLRGFCLNIRLAAYIIMALMASFSTLAGAAAETPESAGRFADKGDGTVLDNKTGLAWLRNANIAKSRIPLQDAKEYIEQMNNGERKNFGYDDWRIPTVDEFMSLIDKSNYYPSLPDGQGFVNVQNQFYWTSTGGFNVVGYVWMVDAASGTVKYDYVSYCNFLYLWPVRGTAENLPSVEEVLSPSELDLSVGGYKCEEAVRPPQSPTGLSATAVSHSEVTLSWNPVVDTVEIAWYNIYENDSFVKSVPTTFASTSGIEPGTTKCYRVSAFNSAGIESRLSGKVCTETWLKPSKGTVWSAGINQHGQLGDGTNDDMESLVMAKELSGVVNVDAGVEHAIAVKSDGTVWTWGRNLRGQLGDGTRSNSFRPVEVKGLAGVVDAGAGWYHSLALKSDGTVWAWGRNYYGQLGDGTRADRTAPVRVRGLSDVVEIAAGWYHSLALKSDGTVWAWGWNMKGQLGNDGVKNSYVPARVVGMSDIVKIAAGMYHSLALKSAGDVWAWGWNEYGQLGTGNTLDSLLPVLVKDLSGATEISGGMHHSVALRSDGKVMAWGRNDDGQLGVKGVSQSTTPLVVAEIEGIQAVEAGAHHSAAIKNDGTVWIWGWNYASRQRKSPPRKVGGFAGISRMGAGMHFTNVLKEN
jgi:alpha-tubulin suppressor-like RCC1 family protein